MHYALNGSAPGPADANHLTLSTKRKADHKPKAYNHPSYQEWSVIKSDRAGNKQAPQTIQADKAADWVVREA